MVSPASSFPGRRPRVRGAAKRAPLLPPTASTRTRPALGSRGRRLALAVLRGETPFASTSLSPITSGTDLHQLRVADLRAQLLRRLVQLDRSPRCWSWENTSRAQSIVPVRHGDDAGLDGASQTGKLPAKCSIRMPMNRSKLP